MRILMVTPYPPLRDGIASYAVQTVARLRAEGHDVEVLSPGPSAAHHHLSLVGPRGAMALAKRVRRYDKVIVQFHPEVYYPLRSTPWQWAMESLALFVPFLLARRTEVRLHEIDYTRGQGRTLTRLANRLPWKVVESVVVHTALEREKFSEAYGVSLERITEAAHGADFRRATAASRASARASLGLPADDFIFLNIGYIQPHKGFDRSVRAMAEISTGPAGGHCRLDIVGSVRTADASYAAYMEELRTLAAAAPGVYLHEGYLSDELFDRWLVACDVVVLPYRSIWSSGVLERALLYQRPVIATDVGGLSSQRADRTTVTLVDDGAGLRRAMTVAVLEAKGITPTDRDIEPHSWPDGTGLDREKLQEEIRGRAARRRLSAGPSAAGPSSAGHRQAEAIESSRPLRNLPPLQLPPPGSRLPGVARLRRLIHRAIAWEIEPLVRQVNEMRDATIKSLER